MASKAQEVGEEIQNETVRRVDEKSYAWSQVGGAKQS